MKTFPLQPKEPFKRTPEGRIICPVCNLANGSLYNGRCLKCYEIARGGK